MKKLALLIIGLMIATVTYAGESCKTCSCPTTVDTDTGDTTRQPFGYGLGADVVVYKGNNPLFEEVTVEPRWDIDNREVRVFGVVRVNLFDYLKGAK